MNKLYLWYNQGTDMYHSSHERDGRKGGMEGIFSSKPRKGLARYIAKIIMENPTTIIRNYLPDYVSIFGGKDPKRSSENGKFPIHVPLDKIQLIELRKFVRKEYKKLTKERDKKEKEREKIEEKEEMEN